MSSISRALVAAAAAAGLLLLDVPSAQAGCTVECRTIRHEGVTLPGALACLVAVGPADDSTCVCASIARLRNDCGVDLQVRPAERDPSCSGNCGDEAVAPGAEVQVEARIGRVPKEGEPYAERVTGRYVVTRAGDPTEHVVEIAATAEIDPGAAACSASPKPATPAGAGALGLGLAGALFAVRRRRARL